MSPGYANFGLVRHNLSLRIRNAYERGVNKNATLRDNQVLGIQPSPTPVACPMHVCLLESVNIKAFELRKCGVLPGDFNQFSKLMKN